MAAGGNVEVFARLRHHESSEATINKTHDSAAPASIVRTKQSGPARHKRDAHVADVGCAKPSSMVMPRAFYSFRRSGAMTVSARTSDLAWQWPRRANDILSISD